VLTIGDDASASCSLALLLLLLLVVVVVVVVVVVLLLLLLVSGVLLSLLSLLLVVLVVAVAPLLEVLVMASGFLLRCCLCGLLVSTASMLMLKALSRRGSLIVNLSAVNTTCSTASALLAPGTSCTIHQSKPPAAIQHGELAVHRCACCKA
jgi:hypothetical protein